MPHPIHTTLADAPLRVAELLRAAGHPPHQHAVVGITGPVGAGKSTLALRLGSCIISTDHYLPDYAHTPEHLRDLPEHADLARLSTDLCQLGSGQPTSIPEWSFHEHRRVGERLIEPTRPTRPGQTPLVLVEGLFALHERVLPALHLAIFVDAPATTRWNRWEHLERTGVRGWGVDYARTFFHTVAEPTFSRYAPAYRAAAHLIVVNDTPTGT